MQENISVNFYELEYSAAKLMKQSCEAEVTAGNVKREVMLLNEMELYSCADILNICGNGLAEVSSELELLSNKLRKIASIYEDTEREQLLNVNKLPEKAAIVSSMAKGIKINSSVNIYDTANVSNFYGHYIENEEWLDRLIMDWRAE